MSAFEAVANRAVGQYPLSIATSLAVESALGVHPDIIVSSPPIREFPELWVNVRTLFRNVWGAIEPAELGSVNPPEFAATVAEEMDAIESIISIGSEGRSSVVFYLSNYAGLERKYPHALLRVDNTDKQKDYTVVQNATLDLLLKDHSEEIRGFDLKIKTPDQPRAMMLTHYAYDLVSHRQFRHLALLESHTGKIKERAQWYSKYANGKELPPLPFTEYFLQVFGDSQTFRPMDVRLRRDIVELAKKYHWTAVTTVDKIRYGIEQLQNPYFRAILFDMMAGAN